jgi:transposase-like protein
MKYKYYNLFPDDQAAIKAVCLSIMNIQKKWTMYISVISGQAYRLKLGQPYR